MEESFALSTKLRELMNEKGKSAEGLSIQLTRQGYKCSKESIVKWCDGSRVPNAEAVCALCHYFGVSADYLLGRSSIRTDDISIEYAADIIGLSTESVKVLMEINTFLSDLGAGILSDIISSPVLSEAMKGLVQSKQGILRQISLFPKGKKVLPSFAERAKDMGDMYLMKAQTAFLPVLREVLGYEQLCQIVQEAQNDE